MSEDDQPVKSQQAALRELSDSLEQSRKTWLNESLTGSPLWKLNYAVSDIGYVLATLDDAEAMKQRKRWVKLQQKVGEGAAWLITIDLLRDSLAESRQKKMASAVARLSAKPVNKCHKLMAKPEWVRIRRWWFGYLESMQPLDPTEAVTVAMTDRAEHRFLKLRNRILKHDNDQDLLKLEGATGELKTILSFSAAPDDRRHSQVSLLGDIESNIRLWRQAHTRLPLLKLLSATPEIDARLSLADDLAEIRLEQQRIARKRRDRVRRLLIGPNSE